MANLAAGAGWKGGGVVCLSAPLFAPFCTIPATFRSTTASLHLQVRTAALQPLGEQACGLCAAWQGLASLIAPRLGRLGSSIAELPC